MAFSEGNLNYLLDEVTTGVFYDAAFTGTLVGPQLYTQRPMMSRREQFASYGSLPNFTAKTELASSDQGSLTEQYKKTFTPTVFAEHVVISEEVVRDEEWGFVANLAEQFGEAYSNTIEEAMAAPFVDARAGATYTGLDALSLINSAHTNVDGGNSQSNQGSSALTLTGVDTIYTAFVNLKNVEGIGFAKCKPNRLLVPPALAMSAWEVINSMMRPDTAQNAMNRYDGMFDLVIWEELTGSTTEWFMIDTAKAARNLLWLWKWSLERFGDGDLFAGSRKIGAQYRSVHGFLDWRWIYSGNA